MMVLRRKEIVAAALVVLIGMAGYLNWHYQDNITVRDGASYVEAGKRLGEAQYVINQNVDAEEKEAEPSEAPSEAPSTVPSGDYFEKAKSEREIARSKSLEILNETAANESFDKEIRKKAQEQIIKTADDVQSECAVESVAKAKGFDKVCVYISEDSVNITVQKAEFSEADAAKLQAIASEQLGTAPSSIKIIEVK